MAFFFIDRADKEQMTYRVNDENIVVQASCLGLVYLITTGTAVSSRFGVAH